MRKILHLAGNDLRLTFRDKVSFFWMLLFPVALMWFFGQVYKDVGSDETQAPITISVLNHDDGWLSRSLIEDLKSEKVNLRVLNPEEMEETYKVRTLVIPSGFTDKVLSGEAQELRLEKEPDSSDTYAMAAEVHILKTIVRTVGRLIEMKPREEITFGDSALGKALEALIDTLGLLKTPSEDGDIEPEPEVVFKKLGERERLVDLKVAFAGSGIPVPSGNALSVPGILTMMILMNTVLFGGLLLSEEKTRGTLRRQMTLPVNPTHVITGKLLGSFFMAILQIVVLLLAGRFLFGLTYENAIGGIILLMFCLAFAAAGLAVLMGAALRTSEQVGALGWILSFIMAAIGGCVWPGEVMPDWMRTTAHIFPTAWAMDGFHALITFGKGMEGAFRPAAVLIGFGIIYSILGAKFLRTALSR
jgi:ABC-type multidrug transport system permease subunit